MKRYRDQYIIPAHFFAGDMGELRKQDFKMWEGLVNADRDRWEKRKQQIDEWYERHK